MKMLTPSRVTIHTKSLAFLTKLDLLSASVFCLALLLTFVSSVASAMTEMGDDELSDVTGQALIQMGHTVDAGQNINFYKAGLDAEVELNMNIDKLQLGCGGVNGPGCDIDIDNLSLSGNTWVNGRPESDAILTRPFVEFAIKNDSSKTLREVVGIRLSAEQATGLLTAGTENTATPNGINSLSGYMEIAATTGTAQTLSGNSYRFGRNLSCATYGCGPAPPARVNANSSSDADMTNWNPANRPNPSDETITGRADASVLLCTQGCNGYRAFRSRTDQSTGLLLPQLDVPFNIPAFTIQGKRLTSASVTASATLPSIPLTYNDGSLYVELDYETCSTLVLCITDVPNLYLQGSITGVNATIPFQEDLGFIHKIPVNNPFSLSMQRLAVQWPDAVEVAQQGWWMSFQDPIDIGVLNPTNKVDIRPVYAQFATLISQYMWDNPVGVDTGDGLSAIFSGEMYKDVGVINLGGATVTLNLTDLQLATQNFTPNCWGTAKFC